MLSCLDSPGCAGERQLGFGFALQQKQGIPFILVGTKLDLRDDQDACKRLAERRQTPISFSEAQGLATELEAYRYLECSALTQHGLKQVGFGCAFVA